jgi:hypothetical protein
VALASGTKLGEYEIVAPIGAGGMRTTRSSGGASLDELHREEPNRVRFSESVQGRDVVVVQRREQLRFTLEARKPLRVVGKTIRKNLDRNVAPELGVVSFVDVGMKS